MASSESFQTLFKQAFSGDSEAFDALYFYVLRIISKFRCGLNDQDKEDVAQEIFEKAWARWEEGELRSHPNLERWIWRVAFTTTVDYRRKWLKGEKFVRLDNAVLDSNESTSCSFVLEEHISVTKDEELPEQCFEQKEEQLEKKYYISHALSQVSNVNRPFLIASMIQGKKQQEIADHFGYSLRTVQRRIEDGKYEFQQAYKALVTQPSMLGRRGVQVYDHS